MSCMTAVHDFYLDLDYSGYHKNLIQQLFSMITDRIRLPGFDDYITITVKLTNQKFLWSVNVLRENFQ